MGWQPKAHPRPSNYAGGYGHRHELPMLTKHQWEQGLLWRWLTEDISGGVMACCLVKMPFWHRMMRRLFETYDPGEWRERTEQKSLPQEFRYPPGLKLDAFWFRLDFDGKNPRDRDFTGYAWERPLLAVEHVESLYGAKTAPKRPRPPQPGPSRHIEAVPKPDPFDLRKLPSLETVSRTGDVCLAKCLPYDSAAYSRCTNKCGKAPPWAGTKNAHLDLPKPPKMDSTDFFYGEHNPAPHCDFP